MLREMDSLDKESEESRAIYLIFLWRRYNSAVLFLVNIVVLDSW